MAVITTIDSLVAVIRKSGLLEAPALDAYLRQLEAGPATPERPGQLAALLVRDGLLTYFQAQQLLAGKSRGFIIGEKYKLLELQGSGGMGKVFLGEHLRMRRLVALKILPPQRRGCVHLPGGPDQAIDAAAPPCASAEKPLTGRGVHPQASGAHGDNSRPPPSRRPWAHVGPLALLDAGHDEGDASGGFRRRRGRPSAPVASLPPDFPLQSTPADHAAQRRTA